LQEMKMGDQIARHENAGHENGGPKFQMTGHDRTKIQNVMYEGSFKTTSFC